MQEVTQIKYRKPQSQAKWGSEPWEVHYDGRFVGEVTKSNRGEFWVADAGVGEHKTRDLAAFAMILAYAQ